MMMRLVVLEAFNAVVDGTLDRQNLQATRADTGHNEVKDYAQHLGLLDVWRRDNPWDW